MLTGYKMRYDCTGTLFCLDYCGFALNTKSGHVGETSVFYWKEMSWRTDLQFTYVLYTNALVLLFYWFTLFLIIYEIKARSSHILAKCSVTKLNFHFSFYFEIGSH